MNTDQPQGTRRSRAAMFAALMRDRRVPHGAFRLYHCLYNYLNVRTGECYPGQRTIADEIGCKPASITRWTRELLTTGWLSSVKRRGKGFTTIYTLADEIPNGALQEMPQTALHHEMPIGAQTTPQKGYTVYPIGGDKVTLPKGERVKKKKGSSRSVNAEPKSGQSRPPHSPLRAVRPGQPDFVNSGEPEEEEESE